MRILLTNNHLARLGGSETWTYTMAKEFERRGYDVGVFTHEKGYVSNLLGDLIDDNPKDYDLALINHNTCLDVGAKFKIFTSHGVVPELEIPKQGANLYVAVNENVANKYKLPYIIKNPIDTDLFKPTRPISQEPKEILAITDVPVAIATITPSRTEYNMPELMNRADVVITIGRGVLEAMSCARNVIIWDNRFWLGACGNGYLKDFSVLHGYVGGSYERTKINLDEELKLYEQEQGEKNREYILKNHDVRLIADKYLNLWTSFKKGI